MNCTGLAAMQALFFFVKIPIYYFGSIQPRLSYRVLLINIHTLIHNFYI